MNDVHNDNDDDDEYLSLPCILNAQSEIISVVNNCKHSLFFLFGCIEQIARIVRAE